MSLSPEVISGAHAAGHPPPGNTSVQRSNANSHWQICKGERAPAMPRKNRLAILLQAGQTAAQKANAKNEEDCDKWCSDIRSKHPELKDTLCDPNFDPFYKIITWDDNSHAVSAERSVVLPKCVVFLAKSEQLTLRSVHGRPLSMERSLNPSRPSRLVKIVRLLSSRKSKRQKAGALRRAKGALPYRFVAKTARQKSDSLPTSHLHSVLLSLNCTVLTRARLETFLEQAKSQNCHFVLLQETRHLNA